MPKHYKRKYLETSVVDAAYDRMRQVFETFDTVRVDFSGGKDSLVCVVIARDVARELGKLPVLVAHRDYEFIPDSIIEFVQSVGKVEGIDLRILALAQESHSFILGQTAKLIKFDPNRRPWFRDPPEGAILQRPGDPIVTGENLNTILADRLDHQGRVAAVVGLRAGESLTRMRACLAKKVLNWQSVTDHKATTLVKPIYDWSENDIFKFLFEKDVPYCSIYDRQFYVQGEELRTSTPLHSEKAKRLRHWAEYEPVFYDRLLQYFPEAEVQARYWVEHRQGLKVLQDEYKDLGWAGCRKYIHEHMDPSKKVAAFKLYRRYRMSARKRPGAYRAEDCLAQLISGRLHRATTVRKTKEPAV